MKSFLTGLCLLLALMSASSSILAKDGTTTGAVAKAAFKNIVVNLNKADADAFSYYLKGIGPKKAQAIVAYRKNNGQFKQVDDLLAVNGIGAVTLKGLKSNVSLSTGETTAPVKTTSSTTKKSTTPSSISVGNNDTVSKASSKTNKTTIDTDKSIVSKKSKESTSTTSKSTQPSTATPKKATEKCNTPNDCQPTIKKPSNIGNTNK